MKPAEVTEALKLSQLKDKIWFVVPSCATTGEGLLEGLVGCPISPSSLMSVTNHKSKTGLALQQRKITPQRPRQEINSSPHNQPPTTSLASSNKHQANGQTKQKRSDQIEHGLSLVFGFTISLSVHGWMDGWMRNAAFAFYL
jgi:hypothetical protein